MKKNTWLIIGGAVAGVILFALIIKNRKKIADTGFQMVLTANQKAAMDKLHAKAQEPFKKLIDAIQKKGYNVVVTSGYRTWAEQDKQHQTNPTKIPPAGGGYHNYGMALDVNLEKDGKWWKMATSTQDWLKTGIPQMAEKMGFVWGGRFKGYPDHVHFDWRKYKSTDLKELAISQFGKDPDYIEGNKVKVAFDGSLSV